MNVIIVENHDEVLPFIYRSIGKKELPFDDLVMVHLDSHPDMLIPKDLFADEVFNKEVLFQHISIENWMLPAVYAGHFTSLIWIKPQWAEQIPEGYSQFYIGKQSSTGKLKVSCSHSYFLGEMLCCKEDELENKKQVDLYVINIQQWHTNMKTLHSGETKRLPDSGSFINANLSDDGDNHNDGNIVEENKSQIQNIKNKRKYSDIDNEIVKQAISSIDQCKTFDVDDSLISECDGSCGYFNTSKTVITEECNVDKHWNKIQELLKDKYYVLDIDLDFFSTMDPFRSQYSEKQYNLIKRIYKFERPVGSSTEAIEKCMAKRKEQIDQLGVILRDLQSGKQMDFTNCYSGSLIKDLVESFKETAVKPDYDWIHEIGTGCDDTELPHHVSSKIEIDTLFSWGTQFLKTLPKPKIVTIARSSEDDYCPKIQVECIQNSAEKMLQELYGSIEVTRHYDLTE